MVKRKKTRKKSVSLNKNEKAALLLASRSKHISDSQIPGWAWIKTLLGKGLIKAKKIPRFNKAERAKLTEYLYTSAELNKMRPKTVYVITAKGKTAVRSLKKR